MSRRPMGGHGSVLNVKVSLFDDEDEDRIRNLLVQVTTARRGARP